SPDARRRAAGPPGRRIMAPGARRRRASRGSARIEDEDRERPMSKNVSDHLLQRLALWGVDRIYGYPGDGIGGIMGALGREHERGAERGIGFTRTRHEELAAFMACAHAKFTGDVGVCLATSGPGAIHLLNGLYDAKLDHQPVLAIVGDVSRHAAGGDYQQEVD